MSTFFTNLPSESSGTIVSINGDSTPAQTIAAGSGISVASASGTTTITATSSTAPGGADTNIQFNNSGAFGGSSGFKFNKGTSTPEVTLGDNVAHSNNISTFWFDCGTGGSGSLAQGNPSAGAGSFLKLGFAYSYWGTSGGYLLSNSGGAFIMLGSGGSLIAEDGGVSDIGFGNGSNGRFRDLVLTGSLSSGYTLNTSAVDGGTATVANHISSYIMSPSGMLATYTITMPSTPRDGQELKFGCPVNGVTALTLSPNSGQTLYGAITALTAGQFAAYKWLAGATSWVRVG